MIEGFVHGEDIGNDLAPLGEVCAVRGDLELDVIGDVDAEDGVGEGRRGEMRREDERVLHTGEGGGGGG